LRCDRNGVCGWSGFCQRANWRPSTGVVFRRNRLEDIGGDGIVPIGTQGVSHRTQPARRRTPPRGGLCGRHLAVELWPDVHAVVQTEDHDWRDLWGNSVSQDRPPDIGAHNASSDPAHWYAAPARGIW